MMFSVLYTDIYPYFIKLQDVLVCLQYLYAVVY